MVIINSVFWFYNFETLKLGDNKQDVIIYGVIIDRSDCNTFSLQMYKVIVKFWLQIYRSQDLVIRF